jgi:hypothetical protein
VGYVRTLKRLADADDSGDILQLQLTSLSRSVTVVNALTVVDVLVSGFWRCRCFCTSG